MRLAVQSREELAAEADQLAHEAASLSAKLDAALAKIRELEVQLAQAKADAGNWPYDDDPPDPL